MTTLTIHGRDGGAATRALGAALYHLAPELFALREAPWERSALAVVPRCSDIHGGPLGCPCRHRTHAGAWYDLRRSRPTLDEDGCGPVIHQPYGAVLGQLPAPALRPLAERLAEQGEATLKHWRPQEITLLGGPERALEEERAAKQAAAKHRTSRSYDWQGAARTYLPLIQAALQQMQDLRGQELAEAATARLWHAEQEVSNSERSLRDRQRAAHVRPERVTESEQRLAQAHEELAAARRMQERTATAPAL